MLLGMDSTTGIDSFAQFLTVLLIFVGVLFLTYFSTKWIATYQKGKMFSSNIRVIETFKISSNKFIQIVRIGGTYYAIAIGKDEVTLLGELKEDEIQISESSQGFSQMDFRQILEKTKKINIKK